MGDTSSVLAPLFSALGTLLPWVIGLAIFNAVLTWPLPGRSQRSSERDVWRGFKYATRTTVMERAGWRCGAPAFIAWGRCGARADEVDHVYPYSKGGPTVASNGQALCRGHNRSKRHTTSPWWYVLGLERRRRSYFPPGVDERVWAVMNDDEWRVREAWLRNRGQRRGGGW